MAPVAQQLVMVLVLCLQTGCDSSRGAMAGPTGGSSVRAVARPLRLRGGGRGHPKATAEEYAAMEGVELTDQQALDLRRHWKKKPEWLEVMKQGVKKRVKTKTILNVMKDRDRLEQKRRKSLPLRLVDLGLAGLSWVRELVGWDQPGKFRPLLHRPVVELPPATVEALARVDAALVREDGYAIAREIRPRLLSQVALVDTESMGSQVSADLESRNHKSDAPALSRTKSGPDNGEPASSELGKMTDKLLVFSSTPAEALSHVGSHTYGEVSAEGFAEILQLVQPHAGEVFVDLGSGTGKAVLTAAALHPFAKAVGVEFVAALHEASTRLVADFQKLAPSLPVYASGALPPPEIEMIPGDVTKVDWPAYAKTKQGATAVVFAACTCWSGFGKPVCAQQQTKVT